jgi:two-component system, OmpR family, KDP operon response regulator KdpE
MRRAAPAAARPRILVVEGEPEVREIFDVFFSAKGRFEVVLARTGADAIEKARERPPDVALLDLELPDMDGGEVLRALRRWRRDLPALAYSGKRPEGAAGAGFSGFFKKPLDMASLVDHVERMLKRRI